MFYAVNLRPPQGVPPLGGAHQKAPPAAGPAAAQPTDEHTEPGATEGGTHRGPQRRRPHALGGQSKGHGGGVQRYRLATPATS